MLGRLESATLVIDLWPNYTKTSWTETGINGMLLFYWKIQYL